MLDFLKTNLDVIAIIFLVAVTIILPKVTFGKESLEKRRIKWKERSRF